MFSNILHFILHVSYASLTDERQTDFLGVMLRNCWFKRGPNEI